MGEAVGTLEITTSHLPGSVAQEAVNPIIEIDGLVHKAKWGFNTFRVSPGQHTVKAYHRWLVFREAYASSTTVDVAEGETVRLEWRTGATVFKPALWTVVADT